MYIIIIFNQNLTTDQQKFLINNIYVYLISMIMPVIKSI